MILPEVVREKIDEMFLGMNKTSLVSKREELTNKYKTNQAINKSVFDTKQDSLVYAISRMPATFAVLSTLLTDLVSQGKLKDISSVTDIGSGTGAGFFAFNEIFENAEISLFERDKNMINVFEEFETGQVVKQFDLIRDDINEKADLVVSSYVFSELNEEGRRLALKKMLDCSKKYVLLVDTGTPRTYENFMKLKSLVYELGYNISAPCESQKYGLKNDYCQFYARVERSGLMKMAKNAELSYEDEKYFYLLIEKQAKLQENSDERRVIRRPNIKTNFVELKLCTNAGVVSQNVTKKDKEFFKKARKIKINEIL